MRTVNIGSHGPGCGYSSYANKVKDRDHALSTQLTSGGNVRVPRKTHRLGDLILEDRNLLRPEFLASFNLPSDFGPLCEQFGLTHLKAGAGVLCGFFFSLSCSVQERG